MSKRFRLYYALAAGLVILVAVGAVRLTKGQVFGEVQALLECGDGYQAAKSADQLNGQSWREYSKTCSERRNARHESSSAIVPVAARASAPAAAPIPAFAFLPAAPAPAPVFTTPTAAPPAEKATEPGRASKAERRTECAAEWKAQSAQIRKTEPKASWRSFWSACDKRLSQR